MDESCTTRYGLVYFLLLKQDHPRGCSFLRNLEKSFRLVSCFAPPLPCYYISCVALNRVRYRPVKHTSSTLGKPLNYFCNISSGKARFRLNRAYFQPFTEKALVRKGNGQKILILSFSLFAARRGLSAYAVSCITKLAPHGHCMIRSGSSIVVG